MTPSTESTDLDAVNDGVPELGAVIGSRYVVEELLGRGGMSVVLQARDQLLNRRVALKLLRASERRRDEHTRRFLREARTLAQLRSEYVVSVLDVNADGSPPYLAMELLEGSTVSDLLTNRGRLPTDVALRILVQACRGVADAHALGIIHRDLKPSNLFVVRAADGSGRVKVIDFGIAKPLFGDSGDGEQPDLTASGQILGSPRYMSPEQLRTGSRVDARSDIWALGAILYELLAGVSPFEAPTVADTLARIVRDQPRPLRQCAPDVPERVASIVALCLSKDPALRPTNIQVLLQELEAMARPGVLFLEAGTPRVPLRPGDPATTERTGKRSWSLSVPPRRRTRRLGLAATVIASLPLVVWLWVLASTGSSDSKQAAQPPSSVAAQATALVATRADIAAGPESATPESVRLESSAATASAQGVPSKRVSQPRPAQSSAIKREDDDLGLDRRE